jgi:potassium intermediate/small conductance calcium-activated channel subfamily N protein 1
MVDNCIDDWLIAMNNQRVLQIFTEVFICLIHPIPTDLKIKQISDQKSIEKLVPIDVYLSLAMFLRLYLLGRSILLHSTQFTNASSRSIGKLKIHIVLRIFISMRKFLT